MRIRDLNIDPPTVLAPLAGITNLAFRRIVKQIGCGLVWSEMISANGLVHGSKKTVAMLASTQDEKPFGVQIFGSQPALMAQAARLVAQSGADLIDINFGCAVKKVVKTGSGVALMRTPDTAREVLDAVRAAVDIPLTIKIRSGWQRPGEEAVEIAVLAERCGVDAISVHPRTATQGFRGQADWSVIRRVKQALSIPVVGNGDILTAADATRMIAETGCDAVMVGRAAVANPWILKQIGDTLAGATPAAVSHAQRRQVMLRYLDASIEAIGERQACRIMRSRLAWFVKGMPNAKAFRESIKSLSSRQEAVALIDDFFK